MSELSGDRKLLQFSVGPVLCCADSVSIHRIIEPPEHLVHLPGHIKHPAIFRHEGRVVSVIDMRSLFGLAASGKNEKLIIADTSAGVFAYWVDEVSTIISDAEGKWGLLPSVVPRSLFDAAFSLQGRLILHVDFEKLVNADSTPWVYESGLYPAEAAEELADDEVLAKEPFVPHDEHDSQIKRPDTTLPTQQDVEPSKEQVPTRTQGPAPQRHAPRPPPVTSRVAKPVAGKADKQFSATASRADTPVSDPAVSTKESRQQFSSSYKEPVPVERQQEAQEESSSWLLPVFVVLVVLLGIAYLAMTVFSDPVTVVPASENVTEVKPSNDDKASGPEVAPEEPEEDQIDLLEEEIQVVDIPASPVEQSSAAKPAQETPDTEDVGSSSISRDGDTVTITVYEDVAPEFIEEQKAAENLISESQEAVRPEFNGQSSEQEMTDPAVKSMPQEYLAVVWSHSRQSLVDSAQTISSAGSGYVVEPASAQLPISLKPVLTIEEVTHIVVKGDTLWDIAKRYINDPFRYPELARLSEIRNPDLIYPGDRVLIRIIRHANGL
ncbi:MAG: chemotaxis protein CheW [Gammaproteobacteria bacterium]|nr:chemotaxis protein CheW [Gammaproteobacteria bacterium]